MAPVQRFTLALSGCFTVGAEFAISVVLLNAKEPKPKLHGITPGIFLPISSPTHPLSGSSVLAQLRAKPGGYSCFEKLQ